MRKGFRLFADCQKSSSLRVKKIAFLLGSFSVYHIIKSNCFKSFWFCILHLDNSSVHTCLDYEQLETLSFLLLLWPWQYSAYSSHAQSLRKQHSSIIGLLPDPERLCKNTVATSLGKKGESVIEQRIMVSEADEVPLCCFFFFFCWLVCLVS